MKIREWINENSAAVMIVAVLLLIVAMTWIVSNTGGPVSPYGEEDFFYDVNTGQLFSASIGEYPPVVAPSGGEGVKAKVFSCTDCDSSPKIAWLEKYPPAIKDRLEELRQMSESGQPIEDPSEAAELMDDHRLFARGDEPEKWCKAGSRAAAKIQLSLSTICGEGRSFKICTPSGTRPR